MAKDPNTVSKFLSGLSTKLQPIWVKEKEEMLELKKKDVSNEFFGSLCANYQVIYF